MCTMPNQISPSLLVPCRRCDSCVTARKNTWVARAMAEKASHADGETFLFMLSYRNDIHDNPPLGAQVFRYKDIQNFMKTLREAYYRFYKKRGEIRYIVAGERGSKRDRVHWHCVIYAKRPISILGDWFDYHNEPVPDLELDVNTIWSLWPHGFLHAQEPDASGMSYALSYALKDQFNLVNSHGKKREAQAENYSSGMFKMSKLPPIGIPYLQSRIDSWTERLVVPTSLQISIPDLKGFWYPIGKIRKELCVTLHNINLLHFEKYQTNCPQWSTLLASVVQQSDPSGDYLTDWDILQHGKISHENSFSSDTGTDEQTLQSKQSKAFIYSAAYRSLSRCGGIYPCDSCSLQLSTKAQYELSCEYFKRLSSYRRIKPQHPTESTKDFRLRFEKWWFTRLKPSRACQLKDTPETIEHFTILGPLAKARPYSRDQKGIFPSSQL